MSQGQVEILYDVTHISVQKGLKERDCGTELRFARTAAWWELKAATVGRK